MLGVANSAPQRSQRAAASISQISRNAASASVPSGDFRKAERDHIGHDARQFADLDRHTRHLSTLGGFRHELDDPAGNSEFVHGRPSTDPRQLLADQHVDDAPSAEHGLHGDAAGLARQPRDR